MLKKLITWLYNNFVSSKETKNDESINLSSTGRGSDIEDYTSYNLNKQIMYTPSPNADDCQQYSDVKEVEIDGEEWWFVDGYNRNRPEDRKLKVGDAIVYRVEGICSEKSVMIIESFDFESDTAARALIGASPIRSSDGTLTITYYSSFVPSFNCYRLAKRDEVKEFLEAYKENNQNDYQHLFEEAKTYNNPLYKDLLC